LYSPPWCFPITQRNNGQPGIDFLAFAWCPGTLYWGFYSHGEWDEKTTLFGANQETFCFDCGEDAQLKEFINALVSGALSQNALQQKPANGARVIFSSRE
jgi:hypothetical protein